MTTAEYDTFYMYYLIYLLSLVAFYFAKKPSQDCVMELYCTIYTFPFNIIDISCLPR